MNHLPKKIRQRWPLWISGGVLILAMGGWVWTKVFDPPRYQGKSVNQWLMDYPRGTNQIILSNALCQIGPKAAPYIVKKIPTPHEESAYWRVTFLAKCLNFLQSKFPKLNLEAVLPQKALFSQGDAIKSLIHIGPSVLPRLSEFSSHEKVTVRMVVLLVLKEFERSGVDVPMLSSSLIQALSDPDPHIRFFAANELGYMAPEAEEAVAPLIGLLSDPSPLVRRVAVRALCLFGPLACEAVPMIEARSRVSDLEDALIAKVALWQIEGKAEALLPEVFGMVSFLQPLERQRFYEFLYEVGPRAKEAIPYLMAELDRSEDQSSAVVIRAIWRIDEELAPILIEHALNILSKAAMKPGDSERHAPEVNLEASLAGKVLEEMGTKSKMALPRLQEISQNSETLWVRMIAENAQYRIKMAMLLEDTENPLH